MRKDIMVDLETLGTGEKASVFQITAMSFDITTGEVKDSINLIGDTSKYELNVEGSTIIKWWLNTDKELLTHLLNNGNLSEIEMFEKFEEWLKKQTEEDMKDVYLWGNGILFDNAKLQTNMNKLESTKYPIFFRNDRDVRTILELATMKSGISEKDLKDSVTCEDERKHDAFDDVSFQIRLVHECYNILMS